MIELQPRESKFYPVDNNPCFEEWFLDQKKPETERIYLPVLFTELTKQLKKKRNLAAQVDEYFKNLDKTKKYYAIVQHDDGITFDTHGIDLKVFGMGCKGDVQIPLVCQPHKYEFKENGRPIFASFVGSITHPIRERLIKELKGKEGYFISTERTDLETYCKIMSMSRYCYCPQGYGKTSFRIQEALQYGAIPIYISDEHLFTTGTIAVKSLDEYPEYINWQYPAGADLFKDYYTYEAVANMIYENLRSV